MKGIRMLAIVLVVLGILGAAYGGFDYTHKTKEAQVGPLSLSVREKHHVDIPLWAGVGAVVVGGVLLLVASNDGHGSNGLG
ncbi:MAG: hypothetical protein ACYDEV_09100 [Acidiferrobacter sp.]